MTSARFHTPPAAVTDLRLPPQKHVDEEAAGKYENRNWSPDRQVLERTGPGIWSKSVNAYIRSRGMKLKQVGRGYVFLPESLFCTWGLCLIDRL